MINWNIKERIALLVRKPKTALYTPMETSIKSAMWMRQQTEIYRVLICRRDFGISVRIMRAKTVSWTGCQTVACDRSTQPRAV